MCVQNWTKGSDRVAKKDENIYYCVGCGKTHPKGNFYVSYSPNHANGRLFYCKDFIKKKVYDNKGINIKNFKDVLRQLDLPFLDDIYNNATDTKGDTIGHYFRMLNSLPQYQGLTWNDSNYQEVNVENDESYTNKDKENYADKRSDGFVITSEMFHRWGDKYDKDAIMDLEKFYNDMHMTHSIVTPQHEKALVMICKLQYQLDEHLENEDMTAFAKAHGEYQKLLQSSGLRPIDKVGGDEATGMRSFSQIFEEVERDGFIKPTSVKENQDIVDKTIQYIMNYTLKLLNQQALTEAPIDTPKVDDIDG